MPRPIFRGVALASIAALTLSLAPAAWAQSDADDEQTMGSPKRVRAPTPDAPDEPAAEPGAAELLPEAEGMDEEMAEGAAEDATPTEPMAEDATPTEPMAEDEAIVEGDEPMAADENVTVTSEAGTGPFVGDYTIGDPDAPVQVVEYASFTCPHCAAFHQTSWDWLEEEYVDTGRIGFTMREVYFDRFGLWASMAARCGGEAAFYPLADQYLSKQAEWTGADDIAQAIAGIARLGGLTDGQLKACLENQDFAKLLVEEYQANQQADEVSSTPTFLVRGPDGIERIVGNKPEELREAIEAALPAG